METPWTRAVAPESCWAEYPRPQLVREHWINLNGLWDYAITSIDADPPSAFEGKILVPFPIESALSGVKRALERDEWLWYRRHFSVDRAIDGILLLHLGAVDYEAAIYLNGQFLGLHQGGYQAFSIDLTRAAQRGVNELLVRVWDPTDLGGGAYGKQRSAPRWAFYEASSGIWQTVWLEHVPSTFVQSLRLTPDIDSGRINIAVDIGGEGRVGMVVEAIVSAGEVFVGRAHFPRSGSVKITKPSLWSPDDPFLYDLEVRLLVGDVVVDKVHSYFGMRKVETKADAEGRTRIWLNGEMCFQLGVVDQGYWPDGLYTAPCDTALLFDLQVIKALGFNTVRKHIKVEPQRWYAHCDRLGLMVWQDMPSGNNESEAERERFEAEITENLRQLHNHPSIVVWVPFNEGWGCYDQQRLTRSMKARDLSRLVNGHSGPYDTLRLSRLFKHLAPSRLPRPLAGDLDLSADYQDTQNEAVLDPCDIADLHYYPGPKMFPIMEGVASVTGEHGSFGVYIEGHVLDDGREVGKGVGASRLTSAEFIQAYAASIEQLARLERQGLSGSFYFQLSDVETEQQGFLTYDRQRIKVPIDVIAQLNAQLAPRVAKETELHVMVAETVSEAERYAEMKDRYEGGDREPSFLRRLAMTARRQSDRVTASAAGNAWISLSGLEEQPDWAAILAIVSQSSDRAFKLLSERPDEAGAVLGPDAVGATLLDIIDQESVLPRFEQGVPALDWDDLKTTLSHRYGGWGEAAFWRARMMHDLITKDWIGFGEAFFRFYRDRRPLARYPHHALCHQVLLHVEDKTVLQAAADAMGSIIQAPDEFRFGAYDAVELDTYANLLYKSGDTDAALKWQALALQLSEGRDREISDRAAKMRADCATGSLHSARV